MNDFPVSSSPLVTAVITTHNRIDLLKKAISSVRAQTFKNIEIIVVDDHSSDGTTEYFESISDIKYIRIPKEESKGGNYARNLGIANASGDYIAFLDDDDYWHHEKIERQIELFRNNADVGVVFCAFNIVDIKGNIISTKYPFIKHKEDLSTKILYVIISVTSALIIRRNLLNEIGCFDENLKFWQEYELTIRLAQITRFDYVDSPLMDYLINTSDKNRLTNKYEAWNDAVAYIYNKHQNLYQRLNWCENKLYELLKVSDAAERLKNAGRESEYQKMKRKRIILKSFIRLIRLPQIIKYKLF